MKGVGDIRVIAVGAGEKVVPVWGPGAASATWSEAEWRAFGTDESHPYGGAWEGEPGALELDDYPYDELCVMLTGTVALTDRTGARRVFRAGEAFFVPQHFSGIWETVEPATKIFVALPSS